MPMRRFVSLTAASSAAATWLLLAPCALAPIRRAPTRRAARPGPLEGDYVIPNFRFASGEALPELRLHFTTLGKPHRDAHGRVNNAVLILHGTGGSGHSFLVDRFAGVLFGKGQLLDANRYYIILPDGIGHGALEQAERRAARALSAIRPTRTWSPPSTRSLTQGLHVDHLRLVLGTSMGCMHTWMWAETLSRASWTPRCPSPACRCRSPGRNRLWRDLVMDAIRTDPQWLQGEYRSEPMGALRAAAGLLLIAGSAPIQMQLALPTRDAADEFLQDLHGPRTRRPRRERSSVPGQRLARLRPFGEPRQDLGAASCGSTRPMISSIRRSSASRNARSRRVKNARFVLLPASDRLTDTARTPGPRCGSNT